MERIYTIPLRKEFLKAPKYKRTAKAIRAIKKFMKKHMKNEDVRIGKYLNLEMWKHGRKNPPSRIQVKATTEKIKKKDKEIEYVKIELINAPVEKKEEKKKEKIKPEKGQEPELKEKTEESKPIEEEKIDEQAKEEKKEVLTHNIPEHQKARGKSSLDKTQKSQQKKVSGIIGQTGKK
ncbi:MAG: 50S ribosomal protein L31e [archaeon]